MKIPHSLLGLLLLGTLLACGAQAEAQSLLMRYDFNNPRILATAATVTDGSGNGRTGSFFTGAAGTTPTTLSGTGSATGALSAGAGQMAFCAGPTSAGSSLVYAGGGAAGAGFGTLASFTVCGWFQTSGTTPFGSAVRFLEIYGGGTTVNVIAPASGDWELQVGGVNVAQTTGGTFNQIQEWIFLAITYDSVGGTVKIYRARPQDTVVTLVAQATGLSLTAPVENNNLKVTWGNATNADNRSFPGYLDDLRIYGASTGSTGALSAAALAAIVAPAVDTGTLLMEYNFSNGTAAPGSSSVVDASGNERTGLFYNGSSGSTPTTLANNAGVSTATGDYSFYSGPTSTGSSLVYAGGGVAGAGFGTLRSFTVCGWFRTSAATAFPTSVRLLEFYGGGTSLSVLASAAGDWQLTVGGTAAAATTGGAYNQTQQWVFVAITYDAVNGVVNFYKALPTDSAVTLVHQFTGLSLSSLTENDNMKVTWGNATNTNTRSFPGLLDDLRVYGASSDSSGALGTNALNAALAEGALAAQWQVVNIEPSWPRTNVAGGLLTHNGYQYAAYYDAVGQMTVAQRVVGAGTWTYKKLPSFIEGSDGHNYVTLGMDSLNYLHVAGNMHATPLTYFRATRPNDIASLTAVAHMTTADESEETYPIFFKNATGALIYSYRNGSSGNGDQYYNIYNAATQTWSPLLSTPLLSGIAYGMSAYLQTPFLGPDGYFHTSFVWRNTTDVSTNHDLGYMRSADLINWTTIDGTALTLPVTPTTTSVTVDPIPVNGGIINGCQHVGFDPSNNVVISYLKYDASGYTQIYLAHYVSGAWVHTQATNWTYRWNLSGTGSVATEINIGNVVSKGGLMEIAYSHVVYGSATYYIDPVTWTLSTRDTTAVPSPLPPALFPVTSPFPGMAMQVTGDWDGADATPRYVLRGESLPTSGTGQYPAPWPIPVMLQAVSSTKP